MKILRSTTRRGFSVATAGWFTVLKNNSWFPASRFPEQRRHPSAATAAMASTPDQRAEQPMGCAALEPRIGERAVRDRRPIRSALVVLVAIAITSALLLWIMQPR